MVHSELGTVKVVGQAVNLSRQPQPSTMRRSTPEKGQHTNEILRTLGIDEKELESLRDEGVI
ncbi:MAG: hypothetical protein CM1200mP4_0570 [Rhodospirillaceae bacterium]|nr:MAG: hypothetical protein CM1200mP4_0570 [Rhodospirillaceae bacterium]